MFGAHVQHSSCYSWSADKFNVDSVFCVTVSVLGCLEARDALRLMSPHPLIDSRKIAVFCLEQVHSRIEVGRCSLRCTRTAVQDDFVFFAQWLEGFPRYCLSLATRRRRFF